MKGFWILDFRFWIVNPLTAIHQPLVQHGANKHTIPNGAKAENISLLTFECVTFDFQSSGTSH
jgi:hypothetical protein